MKLFEAIMKIDTFRWESENGKKPNHIKGPAGWFFKFSGKSGTGPEEQSFNGKYGDASKAAKSFAKKIGYTSIELLT